MEASKVTIDPNTMRSAVMSNKRKRELRTELVKAYIRSVPSGSPITIKELGLAAQFTDKQAASANQFVTRLVLNGVLQRERIPHKNASYWTIPGDAETVDEDHTWNPPARAVAEAALPVETDFDQSHNPTMVEERAKQFAWDKDSDSLREFVAWLQDKER